MRAWFVGSTVALTYRGHPTSPEKGFGERETGWNAWRRFMLIPFMCFILCRSCKKSRNDFSDRFLSIPLSQYFVPPLTTYQY